MIKVKRILIAAFLLIACLSAPSDSQSQIASSRDPKGGDIQRTRARAANATVLFRSPAADPLPGGSYTVGAAVSYDMGKTWTKDPKNPVLVPSYGAWDGTVIEVGTVLRRGNTLEMWYSGSLAPEGTNRWRIGYATATITGIAQRAHEIPQQVMLSQNYPNPFNPATVVSYELSAVDDVRLVVYDLLGREVTVLVNERKPAGSYTVRFDGSGRASGVYFYRLTAGSFAQTRKMILVK